MDAHRNIRGQGKMAETGGGLGGRNPKTPMDAAEVAVKLKEVAKKIYLRLLLTGSIGLQRCKPESLNKRKRFRGLDSGMLLWCLHCNYQLYWFSRCQQNNLLLMVDKALQAEGAVKFLQETREAPSAGGTTTLPISGPGKEGGDSTIEHEKRIFPTTRSLGQSSGVLRILALKAKDLLHSGCVGFLAIVINSDRAVILGPMEVRVVKEFLDVLPNELLGLPPQREINLIIDFVPGVEPISKAPYRMAPVEIKELKIVAIFCTRKCTYRFK
uniref:Uncharacterized protein n=1 Tax=Cannabis sativa TaxID=3483 RepID=A0A803Q156_CANSA